MNCENCLGTGLFSKGESIKSVCKECRGTGMVVELSELNNNPMEENEEVIVTPEVEVEEEEKKEESFTEDSGVNGEAPVVTEESPE